MATTEQIQSSFNESEFVLRTPQDHENQIQNIYVTANSVRYGINRRSFLDDIPGFSVVSNIPHDIMHDILEGVVPYELKLLLKHLVSEKYLTIATLNDRLRQFDFGYSEISDKPSELDDGVIKTLIRK